MVIEEGGEAHTITLCQQCYKEQFVQQGKPRLKLWQMERSRGEDKSHQGTIWKVMRNEQFKRGMWEYFTLERAEARKILADASWERQEVIQGKGQQESPFREVLEQVQKKCGCRLLHPDGAAR